MDIVVIRFEVHAQLFICAVTGALFYLAPFIVNFQWATSVLAMNTNASSTDHHGNKRVFSFTTSKSDAEDRLGGSERSDRYEMNRAVS